LECIRIVLIDMPPLLRDVVRNAIAGQPDLDVVAERSVADLGAAVEEDDPDFVIVGTGSASASVRAVVRPRGGVRVLELHSDGRESVLYELRPHRVSLGEISSETLLRTIRTLPDWVAGHATDESSERRTG
jgi:DNA-binding NarL/FixJ family response regulator